MGNSSKFSGLPLAWYERQFLLTRQISKGSAYNQDLHSLEAIRASIDSLAVSTKAVLQGAFYSEYGPQLCELGNHAEFGVALFDSSGDIISTASIEPGTNVVYRVRGMDTTVARPPQANSESPGRVFTTYRPEEGMPWRVGDGFVVAFSGIVVTLNGVVTSLPDLFVSGLIVNETRLLTRVSAIQE